jgi:outer membrane protein assembly factor BamB
VEIDASMRRRPLRLWPGVVLVVLQWLVRFGVPFVAPEAGMVGVLGGLAGGLGVVVWWVFFSRAPWSERVGAVGLMVGAVAATPLVLHESIAKGAMGMLFYLLVIPGLSLAFVAWAVAARRLSTGPRWAALVAAVLLACGAWALVRTSGFTGSGDSDFAWRWSETAEERLLAQTADEPAAPSPVAAETPEEPAEGGGEAAALPSGPVAGDSPEEPLLAGAGDEDAALPPAPEEAGGSEVPLVAAGGGEPAAHAEAEWPGFRGPTRDGVVTGVRIATDWAESPPVEMWRRPIGPGWSSFAVHGDRLYTQEQRGDDEIVACYDATTGEPVWQHRDAARFWESNAGAGPRATPTLQDGRVYTLGATGIVNALDAGNGAVVWSRNAASDTGAKLPGWGFAGSPLVVDDLVVVATAGALAAYDLATGEPRWLGPAGGWGYSSPHRATIDGVAQIVLMNGKGAIGVAPIDGALLWEHAWPGDAIVQPGLTADGDVLLGTATGMGSDAGIGMRRIAVAHGPGGWTTEERWTSKGLKPYFNDFVVHDGHAFGFDGGILAAIDLADGERTWKGGRYGHGQLVLLSEQDLLLVLSEQGELALVAATPDRFTELARFPAIEGKTWNHPVLLGELLLVRNGEEMAAFRLSPAGV